LHSFYGEEITAQFMLQQNSLRVKYHSDTSPGDFLFTLPVQNDKLGKNRMKVRKMDYVYARCLPRYTFRY
jgi:hypothetical protein